LLVRTTLLVGDVAGSRGNNLAMEITIHRVGNASIIAQVEGTRAGRALGSAIRRTVRASRSCTTVSAHTLLVGTALLVGNIARSRSNHLALGIAVHRVGNADVVVQVERARTGRALGSAIGRTVRARRASSAVGARALLVGSALLIGHIVGSLSNDLAQSIAIHRVGNASITNQVECTRASRALGMTISWAVRTRSGHACVGTDTLLVGAALLIGSVTGSRGNDLALGIAVHRVGNTSLTNQVERARARCALGSAIRRTVRASSGHSAVGASALLVGSALLIGGVAGGCGNDLAQSIAIH
jgi:hypothetical protein